jgi:DNA polymerase III delta prime subunit
MFSVNLSKPLPTFISKYKPYYIGEFARKENTPNNTPDMVSIVRTLMEIDDLNVLFFGNASSGKTTILYAILREYYGLSKTDNIPETNILFINNLKEQGINYFRNEMKTFCQSHCSIYGKKKIIVIDDLDTVNEQSQQVFRNYIDKYKHNIHFISVCTNIQKVIESIQSRLHIIQLTPPTNSQIKDIMNKIIMAEHIEIDEESKDYIMMISLGSIRVLINLLEKIYIFGEPVNIVSCKKICSTISFQEFETYIDKLTNSNLSGAIDVLYSIHDYGYSVIDILDYFFAFIKITKTMDDEIKYKIIPFLCKYITVFHNVHEDGIELALFTNNLFELLRK